ncbi:MAG: acetyl-CoA carboxylase biotin carboxyl carrier protein [Bacteroidia bacterium]|jgi:acetyl-CoA carboxylase biotin carboxyl carrier protein|nr:acetyl-CoA carboxylase biotin carboxyl carrier protein [Bacteroidia bacterium]
MKLNEIQDLIKFVAKSGVSEVELETQDIKIVIKTTNGKSGKDAPVVYQQAMPVVQAAPAVTVAAAPAAETKAPDTKPAPATESANTTIIRSPMIGTFYRSPGPDKPMFVNVGDEIKPGKVICIIEAMKLFNEIESEISGRIVKILVDDASPVEYDQPLFLVELA